MTHTAGDRGNVVALRPDNLGGEPLADLAADVEDGKTTVDVAADPEQVLATVRADLARPPKANQPGKVGNEVFRNGALVRLGRDDDDEPVLIPYTGNTMSELLVQRMTFYSRSQNGIRAVNPPAAIVGRVLDAPDALDVPVVQQIVNAPVFAPDGRLRTEPGLLSEARVWYEPSDAMKPSWDVPDRPTPEHVGIARSYIDSLLVDFPFASDADRAHAWVLLLLPFVRPMIDGPTPLHEVEAPTAGTGKGLLVKAALTPALGYEVAARTAPQDQAEWKKQVTSFLLKGKPVFFLDNVSDRLDSGVLASALTERTVEDRLLGMSKDATMPVRCIWVMTANNPRLSQEIARRCVPIRLDARVARPQARTGFVHDDLLRWARENRGQLVWSALTVIQAWIAAGQPEPSSEVPALGSYEAWRRVVGGILLGVGLGHAFLANYNEFMGEHTDDESDDVCQALDAWWSVLEGRAVTTADLVVAEVQMPGEVVPVSLAHLLIGPDGADLNRRALGRKLAERLKKLDRRVLCEYRIESQGGNRQRTYRLVKPG